MSISAYIIFGICALVLYLWAMAIIAPLCGKVLKMRRLELEAETDEIVGRPADRWVAK